MNYSTDFLKQAARTAQGACPDQDWARLPIGRRVMAIYDVLQRIETEHGQRRRGAAGGDAVAAAAGAARARTVAAE